MARAEVRPGEGGQDQFRRLDYSGGYIRGGSGSERDELVCVVWSLEGLGLQARRGRRAGTRQGKLGEGPRVGETKQGREPW